MRKWQREKQQTPLMGKYIKGGVGCWTAPLSDRGYRMSAEVAAQQATYYIQKYAVAYRYVLFRRVVWPEGVVLH